MIYTVLLIGKVVFNLRLLFVGFFLSGLRIMISLLISVFLRPAQRPWKTSDARLVLEDGSIWRAKSFGVSGTQVGEVVFNTSLTG